MARMPGAIWQPLPENNTQPRIIPTQVIVHTAVDSVRLTDLYEYFRQAGIGAESHLWIRRNGDIYQGVDSEIRADANRSANRRSDGTGAISIETEDDGDPEGNPWTDAQLDSIVRTVQWAANQHGIPLRRCPHPDSPGIGWHSMWGFADPINLKGRRTNPWTSAYGKTCPGRTRINQLANTVFPRLGIEGDTTMKPYQLEAVERIQRAVKAAGFDIGTFGPNKDGIDRDPGPVLAGAVEQLANSYTTRRDTTRQLRKQITNRGNIITELREQITELQQSTGRPEADQAIRALDQALKTLADAH